MTRALAVLILLASPAAAQETRCSLRANLIDPDPAGTNVRSGAGRDFAVVGRLPGGRTDVVEVVAASGAWVKIAGAVDEEGESVFAGQGWVYAPLLGMTISWNPDDPRKAGHHSLHAGPNAKARALARLAPETAVTLEGCQGRWARVKAEGRIGWLAPEAQCANSKTTCS